MLQQFIFYQLDAKLEKKLQKLKRKLLKNLWQIPKVFYVYF